jgi:hypothetical protein
VGQGHLAVRKVILVQILPLTVEALLVREEVHRETGCLKEEGLEIMILGVLAVVVRRVIRAEALILSPVGLLAAVSLS